MENCEYNKELHSNNLTEKPTKFCGIILPEYSGLVVMMLCSWNYAWTQNHQLMLIVDIKYPADYHFLNFFLDEALSAIIHILLKFPLCLCVCV